ncbi:MAG: DUF2333 family protein [Desulfobacterales bacterium]|jgi:hypothetical protein|nr:DUF2333 family protein [Desulfobacterales bacterium]
MEDFADKDQKQSTDREFQKFLWIRIIAGIGIAAVLLWGASFLIDWLSPAGTEKPVQADHGYKVNPETDATAQSQAKESDKNSTPSHGEKIETSQLPVSHESKLASKSSLPSAVGASKATGVEFVEALIKPLDDELNERFWGWRPNDLIQFTDNVNEFQLGVLEVTRRATTRLTDNISRTGSTAALNPHLEQAMNGFMLNSDSYLFPPAETQYRNALEKLNLYKEQLARSEASFYNRPDNLIPLLKAFEELLGSCDENLVKSKEENGDTVSTFSADNYYYYAKGVASAMAIILEAVETDFDKTLNARNGDEILHRALESCHHSAHMDPWLFVTEANLCGIFANHRANMAAHISHARFYVGLLAAALST